MNTLSVLICCLILPSYLAAVIGEQIKILGGSNKVPSNQVSSYANTDPGFGLARPEGERIFQLIYKVPLGQTTAIQYQVMTGTTYKFNATSELGEVEITVLTQAWINVVEVLNIRFFNSNTSATLNLKFQIQIAQYYAKPTVKPLASPQPEIIAALVLDPLLSPSVIKSLGIGEFTAPKLNISQNIDARSLLTPHISYMANANETTSKNDSSNSTNKSNIKLLDSINKTLTYKNTTAANQTEQLKSLNAIDNNTKIYNGLRGNLSQGNKSVGTNKINFILNSNNPSDVNYKTKQSTATNVPISPIAINVTSTTNSNSTMNPTNTNNATAFRSFLSGLRSLNSTEIAATKELANQTISALNSQPKQIAPIIDALGKKIISSLEIIKDAIKIEADKANIRSIATNQTSPS